MKTGKTTPVTTKTVILNGSIKPTSGMTVAAVAGCLLALPLTRAHKLTHREGSAGLSKREPNP